MLNVLPYAQKASEEPPPIVGFELDQCAFV